MMDPNVISAQKQYTGLLNDTMSILALYLLPKKFISNPDDYIREAKVRYVADCL
jgi:hypothetical protein